jgi:hypothetical protein
MLYPEDVTLSTMQEETAAKQVSNEAYVGQERSELGAASIGDADARSEERCDFAVHGGAAGSGVVDSNRVDHVEK